MDLCGGLLCNCAEYSVLYSVDWAHSVETSRLKLECLVLRLSDINPLISVAALVARVLLRALLCCCKRKLACFCLCVRGCFCFRWKTATFTYNFFRLLCILFFQFFCKFDRCHATIHVQCACGFRASILTDFNFLRSYSLIYFVSTTWTQEAYIHTHTLKATCDHVMKNSGKYKRTHTNTFVSYSGPLINAGRSAQPLSWFPAEWHALQTLVVFSIICINGVWLVSLQMENNKKKEIEKKIKIKCEKLNLEKACKANLNRFNLFLTFCGRHLDYLLVHLPTQTPAIYFYRKFMCLYRLLGLALPLLRRFLVYYTGCLDECLYVCMYVWLYIPLSVCMPVGMYVCLFVLLPARVQCPPWHVTF